jgi:hypothetical protein
MAHHLRQPSIGDVQVKLGGDEVDELVLEPLPFLVGEGEVLRIGAHAKHAVSEFRWSAHGNADCEQYKHSRGQTHAQSASQPTRATTGPQSRLLHLISTGTGGASIAHRREDFSSAWRSRELA